jgi:hypothetical protein
LDLRAIEGERRLLDAAAQTLAALAADDEPVLAAVSV